MKRILGNVLAPVAVAAFITTALTLPSIADEPRHGDYGFRHDELHQQFFSKLQRPDAKGSCCNDHDCGITEARWNFATGQWEALKARRWVRIPATKIVRDETGNPLKSPTGEAVLCAPLPTWTSYPPDEVFCFIPPVPNT
jgi:hypothetical protein